MENVVEIPQSLWNDKAGKHLVPQPVTKTEMLCIERVNLLNKELKVDLVLWWTSAQFSVKLCILEISL
ncbi:hypothetical protein C5167_030046 [Papaver somniferum]|nr:hypothetical protein C5167_030046 [Papaver somniferum]